MDIWPKNNQWGKNVLPDGTIYCGSVFPAKPILVYLRYRVKNKEVIKFN